MLYVVFLLKESGVLLLGRNEYRHDSLPHHPHLHPGTFFAKGKSDYLMALDPLHGIGSTRSLLTFGISSWVSATSSL